ncbi:hypothetical protein QJS66_14285 [Kocuria rhizophila]|nr:hypothetical protein QJS66_14285 [Kocuria rhizophila]
MLQGEDQILRRRVSILVPRRARVHRGGEHPSLAAGSGHSGFQVLDMGQPRHPAWSRPTHPPRTCWTRCCSTSAGRLLPSADDIFGDARTASSASYVQRSRIRPPAAQRGAPHEKPRTRSPPSRAGAPRTATTFTPRRRPHTVQCATGSGLARKVRPGAVRSTMFDRTASGGSGGATVAAGAIDPHVRRRQPLRELQRTEGEPDRPGPRRLARRCPSGDAAGSPDAPDPSTTPLRPPAARDSAEGAAAGSTARTDERTAGRATGADHRGNGR